MKFILRYDCRRMSSYDDYLFKRKSTPIFFTCIIYLKKFHCFNWINTLVLTTLNGGDFHKIYFLCNVEHFKNSQFSVSIEFFSCFWQYCSWPWLNYFSIFIYNFTWTVTLVQMWQKNLTIKKKPGIIENKTNKFL